jgi:hypothetical protein
VSVFVFEQRRLMYKNRTFAASVPRGGHSVELKLYRD